MILSTKTPSTMPGWSNQTWPMLEHESCDAAVSMDDGDDESDDHLLMRVRAVQQAFDAKSSGIAAPDNGAAIERLYGGPSLWENIAAMIRDFQRRWVRTLDLRAPCCSAHPMPPALSTTYQCCRSIN
jgi:hypothetical protein